MLAAAVEAIPLRAASFDDVPWVWSLGGGTKWTGGIAVAHPERASAASQKESVRVDDWGMRTLEGGRGQSLYEGESAAGRSGKASTGNVFPNSALGELPESLLVLVLFVVVWLMERRPFLLFVRCTLLGLLAVNGVTTNSTASPLACLCSCLLGSARTAQEGL